MTALPDAPHTSDSQHLIECIVGSWRTQALGAAIKLGIVDELQNEPRTADEIASALGLDAESLIRLLRALCTLGICREQVGQGFSISARGQLLTSAGVAGVSLRSLALWWSGPLWSLWQGLDYSVRTGKSYREKLTGSVQYGHLANDATQSNEFHEAMVALTALVAPSVAQLSLWREATHLVDVGGGYGQLALAISRAHEGLHATIVDLIQLMNMLVQPLSTSQQEQEFTETADGVFGVEVFLFVITNSDGIAIAQSHVFEWCDGYRRRKWVEGRPRPENCRCKNQRDSLVVFALPRPRPHLELTQMSMNNRDN